MRIIAEESRSFVLRFSRSDLTYVPGSSAEAAEAEPEPEPEPELELE